MKKSFRQYLFYGILFLFCMISAFSYGFISSQFMYFPYNPIKYLNSKDNELVSDFIWIDQKHINFFECLPKINHPMLIITGRFDDLAGPEEMQKAEELLKKSKVIILQSAGHESFLDQPKLFNEAILQFVLR